MLVEEPGWLKSLTVQFGRHFVFLPPFEGGENLYKELVDRDEVSHRFYHTISGKLLEWPRSPQHALDFQLSSAS